MPRAIVGSAASSIASTARAHFNVLAALDALTKKVVTIVNETSVTADTVCQLLAKLAARSQGLAITVVLDNVR